MPTMQPDAERELVEEIAACWDDPLRYVMMAFPWGEPGGPLENHTGPDDWQIQQMNDIRDHIRSGSELSLRDATSSGHGIGKSAETAWITLWFCSTRPHCAGVVTANTMAQLKSKTWRELSLWHKRAINAHWFKWTATRFFAIESPETWGIDAIPWSEHNPEAFAGLHAEDVLVIYDEASAIADAIWDVTEGAMTTPGAFWFKFGNPTRTNGRFHDCFGKHRNRVRTRQVDSRTCKMANKAELQSWVDAYGEDSDFVRVRVRGLFPRASTAQLISGEVAESARERMVEGWESSPKLLGVDVARHGDDQSVIALRQGKKVVSIERLRIPDTMQVAKHVAARIDEQRPDAVFVDASGMGWAVVDRLRELNHTVIAVQVGEKAHEEEKYYNLRTELWARMRDWLKEGADIPGDQQLIDDLTGPEYAFDNKMRLQLERKEDMKKRGLASPDAADAIMVTFDQVIAKARSPIVNRPPPNWRAA